jgi:hypothetical protein
VPGELHDHGVYVTGISDSLQRSCAREKGAYNDSGQDKKGASNDNSQGGRCGRSRAAQRSPRHCDLSAVRSRGAPLLPGGTGGGNLCELFEMEKRVFSLFHFENILHVGARLEDVGDELGRLQLLNAECEVERAAVEEPPRDFGARNPLLAELLGQVLRESIALQKGPRSSYFTNESA